MAVADYFPLPAKYLPRALQPAPNRHLAADGSPLHGLLAEFDTAPGVYHAAEHVRDAGFTAWDLHSPFPLHGVEDAMGFKRTKLPIAVGVIALTGAGLGYLMQWWMSAVAYRLPVQGKPFGAWEPFTPITFEIGVLSAAFTALIGMLALNGLPRFHHPLYKHEHFLASSDDKFFIYIETRDPKFDRAAVQKLFEQSGAARIDEVTEG
ncbi:MAG: DUF3341 domain-containing protein [Phycisphaeraceae bacterium]|nr:DUF3341 domain-containing protein [Phycisphaeraceae bacterium]MCW5755223.1 DUF3341 domain-containing protein [Phycisphaeraceae bacterium]